MAGHRLSLVCRQHIGWLIRQMIYRHAPYDRRIARPAAPVINRNNNTTDGCARTFAQLARVISSRTHTQKTAGRFHLFVGRMLLSSVRKYASTVLSWTFRMTYPDAWRRYALYSVLFYSFARCCQGSRNHTQKCCKLCHHLLLHGYAHIILAVLMPLFMLIL